MERERISTGRRTWRYFFNRNYITYAGDTSSKNHQMDLFPNINRVNENIDPSVMYFLSPVRLPQISYS
ncbi:MAG: hypothetical protein U0X76_03700 [Bacteroidia bacterium]